MAYKKKTDFVNPNSSIPIGKLSDGAAVSAFVKNEIKASQFEFYQMEPFEVTEVITNEPGQRASVRGAFINNPDQPIKGKRNTVRAENPYTTTVPLVGEHVNVIEHNGQHFYTGIINRKGDINENSIPGTAGGYEPNTKYGGDFARRKVKPLEIKEGCVLFEGRFGQSMHFDGHNNIPTIKIRTNIDETEGEFTTENIDTDDASITMTSDGSDLTFDGRNYPGKNIIIKSDNIFISGDSVNINSKSGQTIKMGNPSLPMKPTVRGDVLLQFQSDIITILNDIQQILAIPNTAAIAGKAVTLIPKIKRVVETVTKQKFLNKDILAS
tara:strand:+ start:699 stop:1673 length:975 start_codon:yes stop_codon:yes gene_type:complete